MKKWMRSRKNISALPSHGISEKSVDHKDWSYFPAGTNLEELGLKLLRPEPSDSPSTSSSERMAPQDYTKRTTTEERTTAPSGAQKGRKDVELFTAPPYGLAEYGRVCSYGSRSKYAQNNWRLGFVWSLSANAFLRHYLAWVGGEDRDPESGLHHLAHAAWHALVLVQYSEDHPDNDDRFGQPADPATNGE